MINPVNHALTPEGVATYKVEPYVVAADVYALAPHIARGGWNWYTGSAGWMYRLITESLLGFTRENNRLRIVPCLRADWKAFSLRYRYGDTIYVIAIAQVMAGPGEKIGVWWLTLDGEAQPGDGVPLVDDHVTHQVQIEIGALAK